MEQPDTITVQASTSEDIDADRADLIVTVKGASLLTGDAALKKAREIRQLVADLAQVGVPETAITLLSVTAETSANMIGKSSSASYQLRVRCGQLDDLAAVLGAVTSQKNSQLNTIIWQYPDLAPVQDALLQRGLVRAQAKARLMAQTLGCVLERVHAVSETTHDHEDVPQPRLAMAFAAPEAARSRGMSAEDLGLAVTHSKRLTVDVHLVYRVAPQ